MVFEQVYNNYVREASVVDDAMFLKESLRGVKRKRGSGQILPVRTADVCDQNRGRPVENEKAWPDATPRPWVPCTTIGALARNVELCYGSG